MREHYGASRQVLATALTLGVGALFVLPEAARAQPLVLQNGDTKVAIEPYAATSALGSRAEVATNLGKIDTSLTAAFERGGGGLAASDTAWGVVRDPTAWTSNDFQLKAGWAFNPTTQMNLEAGDSQRRTRSSDAGDQLSIDQTSFLRLRGSLQGDRLNAQFGADATTTAVTTEALDGGDPNRQWLTTRRLFASFDWKLSDQVSLQAGQSAQNLVVGWRGGGDVSSQASYLTPTVAIAVIPWIDAKWKLDAEQILTPINPAQFAAYAQLATPGTGSAPQPDRGWRYGLELQNQLPGGLDLTARLNDWRYASVTDLGPVGPGEAPVSIGPGSRQQIDLDLKAPLPPLGVGATTLAGAVSLRRSQVTDPFTGQQRSFSGESPYSAQLRLSGAAPLSALTWSVVATANGPQNLYQMSQVTNLGASTGLGGAVTYGLGAVQVSLQLDNVIGSGRQVTTYNYMGSRADGSISSVDRRDDDARAVRIMLKRGL